MIYDFAKERLIKKSGLIKTNHTGYMGFSYEDFNKDELIMIVKILQDELASANNKSFELERNYFK